MEGSLKKLLDTESTTGQNGEQNFWSESSILLFRFSKIRKDYRYQARKLKHIRNLCM